MTNLRGWVSFKEIVDDVMLAWGDGSDYGQFLRYLNFAIQGYENLKLHNVPATKPVLLDISTEIRAVKMPDDFLKFVSVGININEKFYAFQPKSNRTPILATDCGIETRTVEILDGSTQYYKCFFTLDIENQRILIDAPPTIQQVILNYTPTGVRMDGITYIPRMTRAVIKAWVEYQLVIRDRDKTGADKIIFEKEYIKELNKFMGLQFNADEIFNEYYAYLNSYLKF